MWSDRHQYDFRLRDIYGNSDNSWCPSGCVYRHANVWHYRQYNQLYAEQRGRHCFAYNHYCQYCCGHHYRTSHSDRTGKLSVS